MWEIISAQLRAISGDEDIKAELVPERDAMNEAWDKQLATTGELPALFGDTLVLAPDVYDDAVTCLRAALAQREAEDAIGGPQGGLSWSWGKEDSYGLQRVIYFGFYRVPDAVVCS